MASTPEQPVSSSHSWWQRICRQLWRVLLFVWGTLVVGIVISTIANLNTTSTDTSPEKLYIIHEVTTYPLPTIVSIVILFLVTAISWKGSRERKAISHFSPDQQSRRNILKALRKAYTYELAASLKDMDPITLRLHERFDLTHRVRLVSWQAGQSERALSDGTTIADAYDQAGNGLLILGEPGAGKSTLLYDLAQALLPRAEQDELHPLPVILNLSSWATKRLPLQEWLIEELLLRYLIPRQLSQRWEQQTKLLPLLDGLDEVAASARDACIKAINTYHSERLVSLVVCSRREEYQAVPEQFTLQSAVIVQPLTAEQVEVYLNDAGHSLAAVREVIRTNTALQDLLTTQLMLSVVTLTYKDKAVKDLPQLGTPEQQQQQIFERYVEHMMERRTTRRYFTPHQTRCWLTWLAQRMKQYSLTEFYLEQLQPTWLTTKQSQANYTLFAVLGIGLLSGLLFVLLSTLIDVVLSTWFVFGPNVGLIYGLGGFLVCATVSALSVWLQPAIWGFDKDWFTQDPDKDLPKDWFLKIHLAEALAWSWNAFWPGLGIGLLFGLIVGVNDVVSYGLLTGLLTGLFYGLFYGLFFGLLSGITTAALPHHSYLK